MRKQKNKRNEDQQKPLYQKESKLIEEQISKSSNDKIINFLTNFFSLNVNPDNDHIETIILSGKSILNPLYSIILDDTFAEEIAIKSLKLKENFMNQDKYANFVKENAPKKISAIRSNSCLLISKIVARLSQNEKSKAAEVFSYVLENESFDEKIKINVIESIGSLGDSTIIISTSIMKIINNNSASPELRLKAIASVPMLSNSKDALNSLLKVLADEEEVPIIKMEVVSVLDKISSKLNEKELRSVLYLLVLELKKLNQRLNQRFNDIK